MSLFDRLSLELARLLAALSFIPAVLARCSPLSSVTLVRRWLP